MASPNKYYKVEIEGFGSVLTLKTEKVELKKSFGVFRGEIINYPIKELKNANDVLVLVQDMEDTKVSSDAKNEPKYLDETEAKSEVNKAILCARVRHYIEKEERLISNMNKTYGIILGKCTPGLQ